MSDLDVPAIVTSSRFLEQKENASFLFFNNSSYMYDRSRYLELTKDQLDAKLIHFLKDFNYFQEIKSGYIQNMKMCLKALSSVNHLITGHNQWLVEMPDEPGLFINCRNGLLKIHNTGETPVLLLPHTPTFFTSNIFNFEFRRNWSAPKFLNFLKEILPDQDSRDYIQELLGYLLTYDTKHAKMTLFFGSGANGKSVLLNIFKLIIGKENYSSLPFDAFYGDNRFLLIKTEGKTANIFEEIPEDKKVKTATIKNIVTGGELTVEEKFMPAKMIQSTVKLIFATNTLPNFPDKSDGIYRRLVIIPFLQNFLDPQKANPELATDQYWIDSGELEDIFNWAIEGLVRLMKRGHFIEPRCSLIEKELFRLEQNPERQFLIDHFTYTENLCDSISSQELYLKYRVYAQNIGLTPCTAIKLGREVRRTFPQISQSKNPHNLAGGVKSRIWYGLKYNTVQYSKVLEQTEQINHNLDKNKILNVPIEVLDEIFK